MVGFWAGRLLEAGYLRERGRWVGFDLLQPAAALLEKVDAAESPPMIRHEHGGWKYKVLAREKKPVDWHKVEGVHNWDDYVHSERFKGIVRKIELHDKTKQGTQLLIYSGPVMGDTDEELNFLARQSCDLLAAYLQEKFDMRLDLEHPKPLRPQAGEWTPDIQDIAVKEFVAENGQIRTQDFNMDDSPGTGGEIDFKGKRGTELAKRYVKAIIETPPLLTDIKAALATVEKSIDAVNDSMSKIATATQGTSNAIEKIAELLRRTVGEGDPQPKAVSSSEQDPRRYI